MRLASREGAARHRVGIFLVGGFHTGAHLAPLANLSCPIPIAYRQDVIAQAMKEMPSKIEEHRKSMREARQAKAQKKK